ncbi:hypothetical protein [Vibrio parahaemolyticus]|uniref:hypothetical protein n=1 Tax=Vibrio parahaemolyticus TaxID=670 RepID=UPI0003F90C84|nr:hypothetical protein [Vibrio parahaemolyticus]HDY7661752.1 hypothetical protein [Vibrio vulnificus]EJE4555857.1 hypothetical protein [Vibrio parahaemolyticus]HCH0378831.1 hypothetical protein [Vibrio parahaemolyticus]HCH1505519.1 hypothetical protein [Vibrio parahaemolyticus]HCH4863103.1 hypothetical protein [Vibrio parahaemolyticus]
MSAKYTYLAWNYRALKYEDKLVVLALAEVADRNGNFETSINELVEMTNMSSGVLRTVLRHFYSSGDVHFSKLPPREMERNAETFLGTLQLKDQNVKTVPVIEMNLVEMAHEQNERIQQNKRNNKGKLNRSQRAQIKPLHNPSNEKQYNVLQIHMEEIPDWAEGLMFKKGVCGRQDIWDSFVEDVHNTGEKVFTQTQLTNRLHQKIDYFKEMSFKPLKSNSVASPTRQSALSAFEDKFQGYLNDDDEY